MRLTVKKYQWFNKAAYPATRSPTYRVGLRLG